MHWSWDDLQSAPDRIVDAVINEMKSESERQKRDALKPKRKR